MRGKGLLQATIGQTYPAGGEFRAKAFQFPVRIKFRAIGGMKPYRKLKNAKEGKDQANDNSDQY